MQTPPTFFALIAFSPHIRSIAYAYLAAFVFRIQKVFLYSLFWIVVLAAKFMFNFFFMIRPLVASTRNVWNLDVGGRYDLGFVTFRDTHNVGILVGVWISVGFVYFIDLQVNFSTPSTIEVALVCKNKTGILAGQVESRQAVPTRDIFKTFYTRPDPSRQKSSTS